MYDQGGDQMKKNFAIGILSVLAVTFILAGHAIAKPGKKPSQGHKVTICHCPPGNPENRHTITVSESAVAAHLAHGDTLGPCEGGYYLGAPKNGAYLLGPQNIGLVVASLTVLGVIGALGVYRLRK
jgi:hypothetical protein